MVEVKNTDVCMLGTVDCKEMHEAVLCQSRDLSYYFMLAPKTDSPLYFCGVFSGFTDFGGIQLCFLVVILLSLNQNHNLYVKKCIQVPHELSTLYSIISRRFLLLRIGTLQPFHCCWGCVMDMNIVTPVRWNQRSFLCCAVSCT